jgi:hypothetical protein
LPVFLLAQYLVFLSAQETQWFSTQNPQLLKATDDMRSDAATRYHSRLISDVSTSSAGVVT